MILNTTDLYGTMPLFPPFEGLIDSGRFPEVIVQLYQAASGQLHAGRTTPEQYAAWQKAFSDWQDEAFISAGKLRAPEQHDMHVAEYNMECARRGKLARYMAILSE